MRPVLRSAAVLVATIMTGAPAAHAQAGAPFGGAVLAGARVRVVLPDSRRQAPLVPRQQVVIGTVTGVAGDTLVLAVPGAAGALRVARADLRALAVSRGVPGRAESALRQGVSAGAALALAFLFLHNTWDGAGDRPFGSAAEVGAVGGALGFGIGLALGAASPSERWRTVRVR